MVITYHLSPNLTSHGLGLLQMSSFAFVSSDLFTTNLHCNTVNPEAGPAAFPDAARASSEVGHFFLTQSSGNDILKGLRVSH